MWAHLSDVHQLYPAKQSQQSSNQPSISQFVMEKISLEERVVKLICLENTSFLKLSRPTFRGMFLDLYNDEIPKSANTFKSIMVNYSNRCKANMNLMIKKLIGQDVVFCVSFDEWTSNARRR